MKLLDEIMLQCWAEIWQSYSAEYVLPWPYQLFHLVGDFAPSESATSSSNCLVLSFESLRCNPAAVIWPVLCCIRYLINIIDFWMAITISKLRQIDEMNCCLNKSCQTDPAEYACFSELLMLTPLLKSFTVSVQRVMRWTFQRYLN